MRPIGIYVHHHGDGHRQRALALAATEPERFMLLGTGLSGRTGEIAALDLPDDRIIGRGFDGTDEEAQRPEALHYAPLDHPGVCARMGVIAAWIASVQPSLMIVDVSVEVALLARLCATSVAYMRLGGRRDDTPHLEAFRAAGVLIAPFARALDDPQTPDWIRRKTLYAPGLVPLRVTAEPIPGRVLVVVGRGGSSITAEDVLAAARATPALTWRVIGLNPPESGVSNGTFIAWSDDPQGEIARAGIVIGGAGDGVVGAVLAGRRPFVCIPEPRPFDEQTSKADALGRAGAAIVRPRWPAASEWADLLENAQRLDPAAQVALDDPQGAKNLMCALSSLTDR